eukprot:CAMPEP_0194085398 /NCGR_PEP_ID=MMETSP0149-20130528/17488_1 /TAXON_ID=122233 /ORGANISM="Chaetoceros debilis, Strain MM31A-1" /LENGTH=267 /DNA_ID=CAMNT_0038768283 /DNA_START=153 /DNA_END=957 /DNA_ORIENTATION=-
MTIEIRYPSIDSLPHHIAFPTHILSSNLCTGHMNAIVDGIHVCATEINGVNEFMDHGLVGMVCIDDVLLTEEYFGEETEFGLIGIPSDDLLLEVLHCSFLIALSLSSFVCLCLILAVIVVIVIVIIILFDGRDGARMVSSMTPNPAPAFLSPQSMQEMNPLGGVHPIPTSFSMRNWIVTLEVRPDRTCVLQSFLCWAASSKAFASSVFLGSEGEGSRKGNAGDVLALALAVVLALHSFVSFVMAAVCVVCGLSEQIKCDMSQTLSQE